jgi:plasmid stabilization system protein ParE
MKRFAVEITDEAWIEIEAQVRFIAVNRQAPMNAARWSNRLLKAIEDLQWMPRLHTLDEHLTGEHGTNIYRMVFEKSYLVFYTVNEVEGRVTVLSFRHGARQKQ